MSIKRKNCARRNFDLMINFNLMINFDFFDLITLELLHGISVKFGLGTFYELKERQNNFDFIDFWLP